MGYHYTGATFPGLIQGFLNHLLTLGIQGRGGLIQEKDPGVPHKGTSYGYTLLLPSTKLGTFSPNIGVVTLKENVKVYY